MCVVMGPEAMGTTWNTGNPNWMVKEKEVSLRMVKHWHSGPHMSWDPIPGDVQNQLDKPQSNLIYQ